MTIMDENVKQMKLTHLLSKKILNFRAPFYTSTLLEQQKVVDFLNVHTNEN